MEQFMKEEFDFKRFFLLNIKRIWIVIVGSMLVAGLFLSFYQFARTINHKDVYRVDAIYNIEFDMDLYGDTIQYYNDFTWNDIIDSDVIGGQAAVRLGIDEAVIYEATFVPTMSDIRIIHVYVDSEDKELAAKIQGEIASSLYAFGNNTPGFLSIELWSISNPELIQEEVFTKRIFAFGLIVGFVLSVLYLFYKNAMDDSIYTLQDAKNYTGKTAIGILTDKSSEEEINNIKLILKELNSENIIGVKLYEEQIDSTDEQLTKLGIKDTVVFGKDDNIYEKLKDKETILLLKYGNDDGCHLRMAVDNMELAGVNIKASIVVAGDAGFLKKYYGPAK